jgi:hypothetical protein
MRLANWAAVVATLTLAGCGNPTVTRTTVLGGGAGGSSPQGEIDMSFRTVAGTLIVAVTVNSAAPNDQVAPYLTTGTASCTVAQLEAQSCGNVAPSSVQVGTGFHVLHYQVHAGEYTFYVVNMSPGQDSVNYSLTLMH